tara:strand:+ start:2893 stop:3837 length:945 start_codon:yes stop_codon:yes gene_type:complete
LKNLPRSALIIGGTGFIGINVCKRLVKKNLKVFSISTKLPEKKKKIKGVTYLICDISNKKQLRRTIKKYKRFDYVLNLGGNVNHRDSKNTLKSHFTGSKNLADVLIKKKIQRFIQIGSSVEYGNYKSPHKETYSIKLKSLKSDYGRAKYKATKILMDYYLKFNFPVVILRAYQIYGPYQKLNRILPIIITSCLKKKKFPCSEGKQIRDFIYIDDFVNVIEKFLNNKTSFNGQIFNIGSAKPIKIKKIIKTVVKNTHGGQPIFGAIKLRKDESIRMYPSIEKVKKFTKWRPKINFNKGLKKTILFYKKHLFDLKN